MTKTNGHVTAPPTMRGVLLDQNDPLHSWEERVDEILVSRWSPTRKSLLIRPLWKVIPELATRQGLSQDSCRSILLSGGQLMTPTGFVWRIEGAWLLRNGFAPGTLGSRQRGDGTTPTGRTDWNTSEPVERDTFGMAVVNEVREKLAQMGMVLRGD